MARTGTVFKYINLSFPEDHRWRNSFIYIDNQHDWVAHQSGDSITGWHGSASFSPNGMLELKFDAFYGSERRANGQSRLKTTVLWRVYSNCPLYEGTDYRGRFIRLLPKWIYSYDYGASVWNRAHSWTAGGRQEAVHEDETARITVTTLDEDETWHLV